MPAMAQPQLIPHLLGAEELEELVGSLSPRHRAFAEEYVIDMNGTKAAMRAGYAESGAHVQASRIIRDPKVSKYAAHLLAERVERCKYGADELLKDLLDVARKVKGELMEEEESMEPAMVSAFRGLMETVGKHIDVQAFRERIEMDLHTDHADAMERALRRAETADRSKRLH